MAMAVNVSLHRRPTFRPVALHFQSLLTDMAKSGTKPTTRPAKPYERKLSPPSGSGAATVADSPHSKTPPASSPSPKDASSSSASASADTFPKDLRGCYLESCELLNPTIRPRAGELRDWDITVLASGKVSEADANDFAAWSDSQLESLIEDFPPGDDKRWRAEILRKTKEQLDGPPDSIGRKPKPGEGDIHIRKIPDSKYSFRLWGRGLEARRQYCLDWVHSETGEAVNSPFGSQYELWSVPNRRTPMVPCASGRLATAEQAFGMALKDIPPGQEKFVLVEGTACLFKRPGKQSIYFEVPVRPRPVNVDPDILVLDFTGED
ncbi:hypothetical protein PLICRDRAFT_702144 [Plicaturopsis crispa FD-325 SS-3]|uniref:Uncharacterized protein n=1 Tax=Plicaturopsis crispa FD-325 SS-3 TaxID=944288 RepID=A0A0C9SX99_PLICR|nr:hypothetical protein PLICRDRAFT_702144 [Plicaturopsis crispa FD-325 SS-3]